MRNLSHKKSRNRYYHLGLFGQKKEVKQKVPPPPSIKPVQTPPLGKPVDLHSRPLDLTPGGKLEHVREPAPRDLPSFPVDTTKKPEPLPRLAKDTTVKDFVTTSQPSRPFTNKMIDEIEPLPAFEDEDDFKSTPFMPRYPFSSL